MDDLIKMKPWAIHRAVVCLMTLLLFGGVATLFPEYQVAGWGFGIVLALAFWNAPRIRSESG